ncbi:MAG: S-adenosyl-l-methionine hydroxide adenosyltransferase family protein [Gemmatimonadaceae bacterium]
MRPLITLLTDFGTADGYVGEMKGVLRSMAPESDIVDIAHDIPAHDVETCRLAVARYWRRFPAGTVHIVVVDPGVGSARAALAVGSDGRFLTGPDNGVLSPALLVGGARVSRLPIPENAAPTFHGRDVFAPAAALLATGAPIDTLGVAFEDPIIRRTPEAHRNPDGTMSGEVIAVDRFGNLITNLVAPRGGKIEIAGRKLGAIVHTYADADPGGSDLVAIIGSTGLVEIAMRGRSAAAALDVGRGAAVTMLPP